METDVFVLSVFTYTSWSYDGLEVLDYYVHATEEGANQHAANLKLVPKEYPTDPNEHCTIDKTILRE